MISKFFSPGFFTSNGISAYSSDATNFISPSPETSILLHIIEPSTLPEAVHKTGAKGA